MFDGRSCVFDRLFVTRKGVAGRLSRRFTSRARRWRTSAVSGKICSEAVFQGIELATSGTVGTDAFAA